MFYIMGNEKLENTPVEGVFRHPAYAPDAFPNSVAYPPKYQTLPFLIVILWKYQVFWEVQSPWIVIGLHEYCKFITEKVSL